MKTIRFGGQLQKGDFIAIASSNSMLFGWYIGEGVNTIQFYDWGIPFRYFEAYENFLKTGGSRWEQERYKNGFTIKTMYKDYVKYHDWRACKVDPEVIFTDPKDMEVYEKSREILIKLKFIK